MKRPPKSTSSRRQSARAKTRRKPSNPSYGDYPEIIFQEVRAQFNNRAELCARLFLPTNLTGEETGVGAFAPIYTECVRRSVGEFADLITQTRIAQRKKITADFRKFVLEESLTLGAFLSSWYEAGKWLAIARGTLFLSEEKTKVEPYLSFLAELEKNMARVIPEAERRISLRCVISSAPVQTVSEKDKLELQIARIRADNPDYSQLQICRKLDVLGIPLRKIWRKFRFRLWQDIMEHPRYKPRVKRFISPIPIARRN